MKQIFRVDVLLGGFFCFSFFAPFLFVIDNIGIFEEFYAVSNLSSCVSWKASIAVSYASLVIFDLLVPIYWISRLKMGLVKLGVGHFVAASALSAFGVMLLLFGIPLELVDGGAVFLAKIYCNSVIGSFLILSCIGFSVAMFFSYFLLVVKSFIFFKWR